jgi:hypothetical protein
VNLESFTEVAREVERVAPHIRARVIRNKRDRLKRWGRVFRPTLTVSFVPIDRLRPVRGPVITGKRLGKFVEMERLAAGGIPVPRWTRIPEGETPDIPDWGPHVLLKPQYGGRGRGVQVMPREAVRQREWGDDLGERFAQEFIYTGEWPIGYRVCVLFGRCLFCLRSEASHERAPIARAAGDAPDPQGVVVSGGGTSTYRFEDDREVIEFGERAAKAFPDIPLLGMDVIREQPSGKLYAVESNAVGYVWGISSQAGRDLEARCGFSIRDQFGAIGIAARVLAEETDARAR